MSAMLQALVSGISTGCIYGLIGMGFALIFSVSKVLNIAQGDFFTLGALTFVVSLGFMPVPASMVLAVAAVVIAALLMERLTMRPIDNSPLLNKIIMTVAVALILQGLSMIIFGKQSKSTGYFIGGQITVGDVHILHHVLMIVAVSILAAAGLNLFLSKTPLGRAIQACAINLNAAKLVGIRVERMRMIAYGISGGIGALAGIIVSPLILVHYHLGTFMVVKGLIAAILGGLGNTRGALVGGILFGLLESVAAGFIHSAYKDVIALSFLLLLLFVRPRGILGGSH